MPSIFFKHAKRKVEVARGTSILDAALDNGLSMYHTCGGNASCSTCRVLVVSGAENLSPVESAETQVLEAFDLKSPFRLGCQAEIRGGEVTVDIPLRTKEPRPNKTPPLP
jgi:2Fe-2S ferredoxin